jgi:hypothetical protein
MSFISRCDKMHGIPCDRHGSGIEELAPVNTWEQDQGSRWMAGGI